MSARGRRVLGALGLIAAALGGAPARAEMEHAVLVVPAPLVSLLALYVAEDTHLWQDAGLDIKVVTIPSVGGMNAVIAGSADFSFSTGAAIARAAARGQRLVAIVELADETGQMVVLRKDLAEAAKFDPKAPLPLRARVLKGRTLGIGGVGSIADAYTRVIARAGGIAASEIVMAPMQPPEMLAAFARGTLDGFASGPPYAQQVEEAGTGVVVADGTIAEIPELSPSAAGLLVTRPQYCADHRSICVKMGHSMRLAVDFIDEHPREALAVLANRFDTIGAPVLAASFAAVKRMTPRPPLVSAADLANAERLDVEAGFLKPEDRLGAYDDLFTNEFVR